MQKNKNEEFTFENSFQRLEDILNQLNSGAIPLDGSLNLYEEADNLISVCNKKLSQAERKVETLIKARSGELEIKEDSPQLENFNSTPSNS